MSSENLLDVRDLKKHYPLGSGRLLRAVDGVSFRIREGETLGLVGESGCGKSTIGKIIVRLQKPASGSVYFKGRNIFNGRNMLWGSSPGSQDLYRNIQMVFQDPYGSLNPRMTAGDAIGEALDIHKLARGPERTERINKYLSQVGLNPAHAARYPHEFSGGQRQRIGIARALAVEPSLIVLDEPVSGLDISIRAQIINLLARLQKEMKLAYLFIGHDLATVKYLSDRVAVMYLGEIVEVAGSNELYSNARHPYTRALLSAVPVPDPALEKMRRRIILSGDVPSPINPPVGCVFAGRCPEARGICVQKKPVLKPVSQAVTEPGEDEHLAACHFTISALT